MMELRDYLHFKRIKVAEFARQLDMASPVHLYKIVNGQRIPGKRLAKDIEKATNGEVTAAELLKEKEK